jgi:putative membrane protein
LKFMPASAASQALARKPVPAVAILSAVVAGFLIWLIYFRDRMAEPAWIGALPAANAVFNSLSAVCLTVGYINIRKGRREIHRRWMLSAVAFSILFLASYITYHYFHGDTKFPGTGAIRPAYFTLLISHIGFSMLVLPMVLLTLWYALRGQFRSHRAVARRTFPVWLYVSVTGVLVFVVLSLYTH